MMINIEHTFLFSFLFFLFYIITKENQERFNRKYWHLLAVPIIAYSIILGCRYGWGHDYIWYKIRIENPYYFEEESIGFQYLNIFFRYFGLNYIGVYIVYSFIFIVSALIFIKSYDYNKYMPFLVVLASLHFETYNIRQALAHTFVFLALYFFNKKKWGLMSLMVPMIVSIHSAAILTFVVCILSYIIIKKQFNYRLMIVLYLMVALISLKISTFISVYAPEYIAMLSIGDEALAHYTEQSDRWFGENALLEENIQSSYAFVLTTLYVISIIYMGGISLKYAYSKKVAYMYNVAIIGFILHRTFMLFEILLRLSAPLTFMYIVPAGHALVFYRKNHSALNKSEKFYYKWAIAVFSLYLILFHGRFILLPEMTGFVWNRILE